MQRLHSLLPGANVAVKVPRPGVRKPVRVLGVGGATAANITRKDVAVCGGGYIHVIDSVVLPYAL